MGYFILFMLNQYLNRDFEEPESLDSAFVNNINESLRAWCGTGIPEVHPVWYCTTRFFSAFNLRCRVLTAEAREYILSISKDFIEWVVDYTGRNGIEFPNVDYFFIKVIYSTLRIAGLTRDSTKKDCSYLERIDHIIDNLFSSAERYAICESIDSNTYKDHRTCCCWTPPPTEPENSLIIF